MIRNIIWDVDGTLFDTYPAFAKSFRQAVNDLGKDVPLDWITAAAKISMDYCITALAERCQVTPEDIAERFSVHYARIGPQDQPPFDHVREICQFIQKNGGKNLIVTHRHAGGLEKLLDAFNMRDFFACWITADDDFPRKPDPAAFIHSLSTHQLDPAQTMAVGDRAIDILAGQGAGLIACLFGNESHESKPELEIQSYKQLLDWLIKQSK